VRAKI